MTPYPLHDISDVMRKPNISKLERLAFADFWERHKDIFETSGMSKDLALLIWHDGYKLALKTAIGHEVMPYRAAKAVMSYFESKRFS